LVAGAVVLALLGVAVSSLILYDAALAAGLLRLYWFRLADVAVPMGVALGSVSFVIWRLQARPAAGRWWLVLMLAVAAAHLGGHALRRVVPSPPPADRLPDYVAWRLACDFIDQSGQIPPDARFLTPRMNQTFKWYARRPEVANWKEIPQNASAIVEWWRRMRDLHATGSGEPDRRWYESLAEQGASRLVRLGRKYGADYVVTTARPHVTLPVVYANRSYVVYRLP
jgi:hypothetical protein